MIENKSPKHSPLPWECDRNDAPIWWIEDADGNFVADILSGLNDAQLIVRAVNSHEVAVELAKLISLLDDPCHFCPKLFEGRAEHSPNCLTNLARKFQEMNREES